MVHTHYPRSIWGLRIHPKTPEGSSSPSIYIGAHIFVGAMPPVVALENFIIINVGTP